jgi:isocitrate dehydrogenase
MKFEPAGDGEVLENTVLVSPSEGIAMEMHNSDESIRNFARACLNHCLELG